VKSEFSSYLKADYVKDNWSLYADVQYRYVDYNFGGFDDVSGNLIDLDQKEVYNFINPKVGGSFAFDANNRLFLSAGIGNREPVRKDFRESSTQSRPEHETLMDLELGHAFESKALQVRTNIYFMNYTNQLINTGKLNDVGASTRVNVDESFRLGIELAAIVRPIDELDFHAGFTYSENKIASFTEYVDNFDNYDENGNMIQDIIDHTDTDMAFSPNLIGNVGFTYRPFDGFALNWMTKYVGDQFLDNTSNQDRKIDAFTYSNVSLNYTIEDLVFSSITLGIQCNNILDAKYQNNGYTWGYISGGKRTVENFYYPQAGRNFMFRLLINM
jgi:iron complex outermembrane receptor protein